MMHAANVGPHSRVLCLDASGGVAAAACVERMGGSGTLCCAHAEAQQYHLDCVRLLNCHTWVATSTRHCALTALLAARTQAEYVDSEGQNAGKKQKVADQGSKHEKQPSDPALKPENGSCLELKEEQNVREGNELNDASEAAATADCDVVMSTAKGDAATTSAKGTETSGNVEKADAAVEKGENVLTTTPGDAEEADTTAAAVEGAAEKPVRPVRAASALLRLGKPMPEGFKPPEMVIPAGGVFCLRCDRTV